MSSYRNQRFKRGNTLTLAYNPFLVTDSGVWDKNVVDMGTYETIDYYFASSTYPSVGDIVTCSSFGGLATDDLGTGGYSAAYSVDDAYDVGGTRISIPKDCFDGQQDNYLTYGREKIYAFNPSGGVVYDVYISEYIASAEYGKYGQYGVNYRVNPDDRIKVIVPTGDFDVMCQILMSEAVALMSCDDVYSATPDIPEGIQHIYPYGGGSFNPIIRQGAILTNSIKKVRGINSYELEIKLLG